MLHVVEPTLAVNLPVVEPTLAVNLPVVKSYFKSQFGITLVIDNNHK